MMIGDLGIPRPASTSFNRPVRHTVDFALWNRAVCCTIYDIRSGVSHDASHNGHMHACMLNAYSMLFQAYFIAVPETSTTKAFTAVTLSARHIAQWYTCMKRWNPHHSKNACLSDAAYMQMRTIQRYAYLHLLGSLAGW